MSSHLFLSIRNIDGPKITAEMGSPLPPGKQLISISDEEFNYIATHLSLVHIEQFKAGLLSICIILSLLT